jgi:hypothetical protein
MVPAERLAHDLGELAGALDRPRGDDRAGDAARLRLLAIAVDDVGDLGFVGLVEEVGGARPSWLMRMSSGPSAWKEKPRSAWSSCMEETPISSVTPSTASTPRSASA